MSDRTPEQTSLALDVAPKSPVRRLPGGRPAPSYVPSATAQFDLTLGCPDAAVPSDHPARVVWELVEALDFSRFEAKRSWLGRKGFEPKRVFAVWVYASLKGVHEATAVAREMKLDLAYRFLSGCHSISVRTLSRFRQENGTFFADLLNQTVKMAVERGLVDPKELAVDAMRLRADASTGSVRTAKRSKKRLAELAATEVSDLSPEDQEAHRAKVRKHEEAAARCEAEGRTSHSVTDPHASLMKFPSGAAHAGHRVTVGATRSDLRLVVAAFVDSDPTDYGKLEKAVTSVEKALVQAGVAFEPGTTEMQVAADAGYLAEEDLRYAAKVRPRIDILIPVPPLPSQSVTPGGDKTLFGKDAFTIRADGTAICPAGTEMQGPTDHPSGLRTWRGVGCATCSLKGECTRGKARTLSENRRTAQLRAQMRERMSLHDAKARYNRRIATVEPVFSYVEDTMGYRRASSRHTETVRAEVLLKLVAYNLLRLHAARQKDSLDCIHVTSLV